MNCERARRWFVFAQEGVLSARRRRALERHLSSCAECCRWADAVARDADLLRRTLCSCAGPVRVKDAVLRAIAKPAARTRNPRLAWVLAGVACATALLAFGLWIGLLSRYGKGSGEPVPPPRALWLITELTGGVTFSHATRGTATHVFSWGDAPNDDWTPIAVGEGSLLASTDPGRVALVRGNDVVLVGGGSWLEIGANGLILWHGRVCAWVQSDRDHPFRVATKNTLVEALGTVFAVTAEIDAMTTVTVAEGDVRLSNDQGQTIVGSAQTAVVANGAPSPARPADLAAAMRWTHERIEFFAAVRQLKADIAAAKEEIREIRRSLEALRPGETKGGTL